MSSYETQNRIPGQGVKFAMGQFTESHVCATITPVCAPKSPH